MKLEEFRGKQVLIVGFAREGRDVFGFLRKRYPNLILGIADEKESLPNLPRKKVRLHLGNNYLKSVKRYDVIVRSPGVPLRTLKRYLLKKHRLTSETDIFFSECRGTIIGITGTKGKSTTASLIYHILKTAGKNVKLVGNIGIPALGVLPNQKPEDIFVFELSSFQLEDMNQSPHVAVLLNLFQEHTDHHGSFAAYKKAKANITRHQGPTDILLYNSKNKDTAEIAKESRAHTIPFTQSRARKNAPFLVSKEPALMAGKLFGVSEKTARKALKSFQPLPHRLEYIGKYKGICFVNDSLATIPEAAIGALDLTARQATTLIAGGYDRGVDMKPLARRIEKSAVNTLILFPNTGKKILKALKKKPGNVFEVSSMNEAVKLAYKHTKAGKTCLLSPAASSFSLFQDYKDRGEQFKQCVKEYGRQEKK